MIIAPIMEGPDKTTNHVLLMNADELATIMEVFVNYCEANKRKKKAKKMFKQFKDECRIF